MSLFRRPERRDWNGENFAAYLSSLRYGTGSAAPHVTPQTAEAHWAVSACVNRYSDAVSILPLDAVRADGDTRAPIRPKPAVLEQPSPNVDTPSWLAQVVRCMWLRGFAAGIVSGTNARNWALNVELISPDDVVVRREEGRFRYYVNRQEVERWPFGPLWLVPGKHEPTGWPIGVSVIEYARQSIQTGLSAQQLAGATYTAGAPAAVLETDAVLSREQSEELGDRFDARYRGGGKTAVLSQGATYKPVQLTPADAMFIDSQQWSVQQVCAFFDLDPTEIGGSAMGSKSLEYANRQDNAQQFLTKSLAPILTRIEFAMSQLFPPRTIKVKFNTGAMLRADVKTRYETYRIANPTAVWLDDDEIRALEDLPPLPKQPAPIAVQPAVPQQQDEPTPAARQFIAALERIADRPPQPIEINVAQPPVTVHQPSVNVDARSYIEAPEPAQVNVTTPEVRNEITVEPAQVEVTVPEQRAVTRTVERDEHGRIVRIEES